MERNTCEQFRQALLSRRVSLLRRWRQARADWQDDAAAETAPSMLDSIDERGRRALARIQSCLVRIARGSYDECVACRGDIDEERLRAVPDTDRCGGCATEN
jgi:RNA polymerase-binding transcription factor DksA